MILVMVLAGLSGVAVVAFYRLWIPAAPNLLGQLDRWEQNRRRATRRADTTSTPHAGAMGYVAQWSAEQLRVRGPDAAAAFERDLAIVGKAMEAWLAATFTLVLVGFIAPFALGVMGRMAGIGVSFPAMAVCGIALAGAMVLISHQDLRRDATRARENFRDALSGVLDMLVMSMEGGRGHAEALPAVAEIGTGWEFEQMWAAIDNARTSGITPWEALGRLGERYGVSQLIELRAALTLAQEEGGKIRETLIARAQTLRDARLSDAKARAKKRTESMGLTLLFMAFLGAAYVIIPRLMYLATSQ